MEWSLTFIAPALAHAAPQFLDHPDPHLLQGLDASQIISTLLTGVGLILFAVATLRAGVLPRAAAVLALIGIVVIVVVNLTGLENPVGLLGSLGTLGLAWMGYAVWSRTLAEAESTTPMTAGHPGQAAD